MSGCLKWFGVLLIIVAVCLLSIGGLEASEWLTRVSAVAAIGGLGDAANMKAVSHFLQYVFLTAPLFAVGLIAFRAGRRREEKAKDSSTDAA